MSIAKIKIGDVTDILSGFAFKSDLFSEDAGFPVIRIRDVLRGRTETYYTGDYDERFIINDGDIVIGMDGNFNAARWKGGKALLNQRVCKITARSDVLDESYLFHFLPLVLKKIEDATPFVTVKHLSANGLRDEAIPLPALAEQRRIAAILDKADTLRAKRYEAFAHLDRLAQSIFVEMFGDPATNPKGWPVRKIGDLLTSASYGTSEKSGTEGKFPVLRMNNITRTGEMDFADLKYTDLDESEYDRYLVKQGDVLFNRTNSAELVGKTALYRREDPMAYAGYLIRLRTNDENDPEYLAGFLNTDYSKRILRSMCKSIIGMANINATEIQAMRIAQPPRAIQNEYRERISGIVSSKALHQRVLREGENLFASLQLRAFTGEL
ncbi:restriction endonuclease subunit S [Cupriavidus campinensis]|uniref:Restriction endonuclease subunit S n=1 Tax=Cupriavidus campinensis TaxID=151783 RepID=A0AAE9I0T7_9BURK|nr:restriction endonuclease subunit S [Cupriavidus campinensis]URF04295.1 restriction endonuclease subunit S [Cupriavidus campinensis]